MESITPIYGIYFDLDGLVAYDKSEFQTIRKVINNIINNRYYQLELTILFNDEIPNYDGMRKQLSNDIMQIIGQIDDELVDDVIDEVKNVLAIEKVIRHRSSNSFNNTGFPDEELHEMYNDFIDEAMELKILIEDNDLGALNKNFDYAHLPNLEEKDYLAFCKLLIVHGEDLDSFEMLYDLDAVEACFKNFPYLIRYLDIINFNDLIRYYKQDLYKIMRNIRFYVKQVSDVYNDNIKELFIYRFILNNKFNIEEDIYDPEEGLNKLREIFEEAIFHRDEELIAAFDQKVHLFKNDYHIISIGDTETKSFKQARRVANIIKRNVVVFDQLLEAFRKTENTTVRFNCKFNNTEEYRSFLDLLKKVRYVKEYQEKYSLFTITLESTAIPFLQGKWFEYYTSSVCEGIIENYIKQGHTPDYGLYQNVIVEMNGARRELDIIIHINDLIYYIENKVEKKNTFKVDLLKYRENSKKMNIDSNNCYLVYLNGDDSSLDDVRVCNIQSFITQFKKGVLQNLELQKQIQHQQKIEAEKASRLEENINKAVNREKARLFNLRYDEEVEERRIKKAIEEYKIDENDFPKKEDFFSETKNDIDSLGDNLLKKNFARFQKKYYQEYLLFIEDNLHNSNFFKNMFIALSAFDQEKLKLARVKLLCLADDFEGLVANPINPKLLLPILCGYGTHLTRYYELIIMILTNPILYTWEKADKAFIHFLNAIEKDIIERNRNGVDLFIAVKYYLDFVRDIVVSGKLHIKNPKLKTAEEDKFINVLLYTFLHRHYDDFNGYGLSMRNTGSFLAELAHYTETKGNVIHNDNIEAVLGTFDCSQITFMNDRQIDAASYLFLNYHVFKDSILSLKANIEPGYIFELPKSDQVIKLLKLLNECDFIKEYREVKNTDQVVGIFTNDNTYRWVVDYHWIGIYLTFYFETNPAYCNLGINNKKCIFLIHMIVEYGNLLIVSTSQIRSDGPYGNIAIVNISQLKGHLSNLDHDSFKIPITEMRSTIERIIEGLR